MTDRAERNRERRKRADGTEIDPVNDLAEFLQGIPQSPQSEPEPAPSPVPPAAQSAPAPATPSVVTPAPQPPAVTLTPTDAERRAALLEQKLAQAQAELNQHRTRAQVESMTRQALAEQQPKPQMTPAPEDPRLAQIDDLWFTDAPKARALQQEVWQEQLEKKLEAERTRIKQDVFTEMTEKQRREQGEYAFATASQQLEQAGAKLDTDRITAVYTVITRRPTPQSPNPYYDGGGPLNPNVIVKAYQDLFGAPTSVVPPAPAVPQAPIVTPPGSSRPAPAAAPPSSGRAIAIDANTKRDYDHMAESLGLDKEGFLNRRRARLAAQEK